VRILKTGRIEATRDSMKRKIVRAHASPRPRAQRFEVSRPRMRKPVRIASAIELDQMKRESQARDRKFVAKGGAIDEMFLIRPDLAEDASIAWPEADI
jgi:hypothetical protein